MKLFSKLKDYHNGLEEILDRKTFSSISKSLLLSMMYKLEISYKDYAIVKPDAISKDAFLENVLQVVKLYCDHIKTVEPGSQQAQLLEKHHVEAVTNSRERSILAYPTERAMLYAVCDIEPKYFFLKKDFAFKHKLQKVLVDGYKQNTMEILRNFSGWSWDVLQNAKDDYRATMIYQNLMMMVGEEFLTEWRRDNLAKQDYLGAFRKKMKEITGNERYYVQLCRVLYVLATLKEKDRMEKLFSQEEQKIVEDLRPVEEEWMALQKEFLKYFQKKIAEAGQREEILELLYEIRYYQTLTVAEGVAVKDCSKLKRMLDSTLKLLFTKACQKGVLRIVSMDIETNFKLLKDIFATRIIDLEKIRIYVEMDKTTVLMKIYDKEVFEKQLKEEFSGEKKDIAVKRKKMVKIFT